MNPASRSLCGVTAWLLVGLSISCGGASPHSPEDSPVVTAVQPSTKTGSVGGWIRLHGSATGSPTKWTWDAGTGGSVSKQIPSPRLLLGDLSGTYHALVKAENSTGESPPFEFEYAAQTESIPPSWRTKAIGEIGNYRYAVPALIVTEEVTLIFYSTNLEGGFQGRIAVAPMVEDMTLGAWETYVLTSLPPDYPPYPFGDGDYYGARFIQHGDHIYLYVDEGAAGNKLLATAAEIPTTANHWVATEILSFVDVPDSDSGAAPGRLAFIGDKPVFIGAHEVFSEAFGGVWFYFDYLAIANTPLPDSRDDWDVMALPEPAGSSMDADQRDNFALAISTTSDGGIAYVEPDLTGRLQVYYTPNEAALRAGAWQPGFLSDPLWTNGTPVEFLPYHDRLLLAYNPISGGRRLTDQLHLALSADSTGTVSSWSIQPLTGVLTPGTVTRLSARTATPLAIWGDRLILFEDDANGVRLRRATVSGLPAMDQWQSQLIAPLPPYNGAGGPSRPGTAIAVHGLDCFVAFANTENPDVPGELSIATAEGSW